jgi:hypothetical protein
MEIPLLSFLCCCWLAAISQLTTDSWLQLTQFKVKVKITLWLAVYRQSIRLGAKPLGTHDQIFCVQLNRYSKSLCNVLSDKRVGLSLMNMLGLSSSHWSISFGTTQKSSVSTGFAKQIMPILRILCYNGSLVNWTVVSLITAKFKRLIFSTSGFALSYIANTFILVILYDFCLLPARFCNIIVYIQKVENRVQNADRCAPWKIPNGVENLLLYAQQF